MMLIKHSTKEELSLRLTFPFHSMPAHFWQGLPLVLVLCSEMSENRALGHDS